MRTCFIPGSFNPFTLGHKSLVDRALSLFDQVVIGVGVNSDKPADDAGPIVDNISRIFKDQPRVEVISYKGLTVNACRQAGADCMVRGVRTVSDFEYERELADVNRKISGIETLVMFTLPQYSSISSTIVRELRRYGIDTSQFVPKIEK